ncbi:MAG: GFA family protein [Myxococcota bacterium]|nr:GFA family protein [Myxococcota bacterium]
MVAFPQAGGCLCGDLRYSVTEDPVTLYVCYCTDCQRQSGASFALSMLLREQGLRLERGSPREFTVQLDDGRRRRGRFCGHCGVRLWAPSRAPGLVVLEPGTLDDTSWLRPVGAIWTRSAQPWLAIPPGLIAFEKQPADEEVLEMARAWKARSAQSSPTS